MFLFKLRIGGIYQRFTTDRWPDRWISARIGDTWTDDTGFPRKYTLSPYENEFSKYFHQRACFEQTKGP